MECLLQAGAQRAADERTAHIPKGIKPDLSFLRRQRLELGDGKGLAKVIAKDADVDVLGEPPDQAMGLRE